MTENRQISFLNHFKKYFFENLLLTNQVSRSTIIYSNISNFFLFGIVFTSIEGFVIVNIERKRNLLKTYINLTEINQKL